MAVCRLREKHMLLTVLQSYGQATTSGSFPYTLATFQYWKNPLYGIITDTTTNFSTSATRPVEKSKSNVWQSGWKSTHMLFPCHQSFIMHIIMIGEAIMISYWIENAPCGVLDGTNCSCTFGGISGRIWTSSLRVFPRQDLLLSQPKAPLWYLVHLCWWQYAWCSETRGFRRWNWWRRRHHGDFAQNRGVFAGLFGARDSEPA